MSHVVTVAVEIKDLAALALAAKDCGMELVKDVATYKWFGQYMGDYPLPAGFTREELGTCDHVLRVKGAGPDTYEVGVKRKNGKWVLAFDFWGGGYGLEAAIGPRATKLAQRYSVRAASRKMARAGYRVTEVAEKNGSVRLVCSR